MQVQELIANGGAYLGLELGSTRIKAVLIDNDHQVVATGSYGWENRYEGGYWTYHLEDVWTGIQAAYTELAADVKKQYGVTLTKLAGMGFSAMMHGYLPFDKSGALLAPLRTWRNTTTGPCRRGIEQPVPLQHSPALEHCPSVSGHAQWGGACGGAPSTS